MANVDWPVEELEVVASCPVCGSHERGLLHVGLTDRVFCIAPGSWNMYRCASCGSGYLDPRPTPNSIGRAYAGYYTHDAADHPIVRRKGGIRTVLHDMINGYQNARYRLKRSPSLPIGRWLLPLLPSLRFAADAECRHLPPLPRGGGSLLDVGCGNGGFLLLAQQAGWTVEGIDFDAGAVQAARSRGLNVRCGGVEMLDGQQACFDVITLSHVIEHVHEPNALLKRLNELLKPDGVLWLETPNLSSLGALRFNAHWRGLEPPRHLVLFNRGALLRSLRQAGFTQFRQYWHGMTLFNVFAESEAIALAMNTRAASRHGRPPWSDLWVEWREMLRPGRREFLTFTARK